MAECGPSFSWISDDLNVRFREKQTYGSRTSRHQRELPQRYGDRKITAKAGPRYQMKKALVFLIENRRFFVYACLISVDFLQLPSVVDCGTKVVLYVNAAQDQGIDT